MLTRRRFFAAFAWATFLPSLLRSSVASSAPAAERRSLLADIKRWETDCIVIFEKDRLRCVDPASGAPRDPDDLRFVIA